MSIKEDTEFKKAYARLEQISDDPYLQRIEELKMKKILDDNNVRHHLTEEGKKLEKIEIARNMLKEKIAIEVIEKVTGLTIEEIKKL